MIGQLVKYWPLIGHYTGLRMRGRGGVRGRGVLVVVALLPGLLPHVEGSLRGPGQLLQCDPYRCDQHPYDTLTPEDETTPILSLYLEI